MKIRRIGVAVAAVTAATLVLAGCSASSKSSKETSEIQSGTSVTVAENSALTTLNSFTATGYSTYNSNIQYLTQAVFNYYDAKPALVKNPALGTYKELSASPLTIKYTLKPTSKWSDGQPITATDLLLEWAASLTKYNSKDGVNFGGIGAGSGLDYVTKTPTVSDGGRSVTFVFSKPYVDWETAGINPNLPAHILYQEAFPGKKVTATQAAAAVQKAILTNDTATLKTLGTVWNTKWNVTSLPSDKKLLVASGPYTITSFTKNQSVTLTARKNYTAGPKPKIAKITVRFIPDQTAQVQALQNGEISIMYGQATADTVKALKQVKNVTSTTTPEASYEHIDLTFNNKGPFDPASYGGDATKALEVRQAFMKVIPRQQMLDRLIKPLSSSAKLDDSQLFLPGAPGYDQAVKANGYSAYQTVDVAGAKALLQKAGVKTPLTVKFAYATDNPRRVGEFQLLQASAKQAGFNVTDVGKTAEQFFDAGTGVGTGKYDYDACVFAYVLSAIAVGQSQGNTTTGNAYNYNGYSNKEVDSLWQSAVQSADYNASIPDQVKIDTDIIKDASSIALYQLPDVSGWSTKIASVKDAPLTPNIYWNFFNWSIKK